MDIFNTWQLNLLGSLIFVVIFYQFYKLSVKSAKRDGAATILLQSIGGISILLLTPLFQLKFPTEPRFWLMLIGACIFYAVNDRLQTTGRKHLEVSVVSILNQLSTVLLIMFGLFIFKEDFVLLRFLGAGLILMGNISLLYKGGKFEVNKYVGVMFLAILAFVVALSIDIDISSNFNLPIYISLTLLVPASIIGMTEKIKIREVINEFKTGNKKYYITTGVAWGLCIFFQLRAFQFGRVTTIVPLQATSVLINVLVAYFLLGEKSNSLKKVVAAILVMVGVYLTV